MATVPITAPGGPQAEQFLKDRFGLSWGADVLGIPEDGVTAESTSGTLGIMEIKLIAQCTREDVEKFVSLLWSKEVV